MATITPLANTPAASKTIIDTNFTNLNNDKSETSHTHAGMVTSAYDDLIAESKIGTGSTQVAAGNHTHAAGVSAISMTLAEFNTETTSGTVRGSNGYTLVYLEDAIYTVVWDGSVWRWYRGNFLCTLPVSGDFAWINQEAAAIDLTHGGVYLYGPAINSTALRIRKKALASLPVTYTAGYIFSSLAGNVLTAAGLLLRESATGKIVSFGHTAYVQPGMVNSYYYASPTSAPSNLQQFAGVTVLSDACWVRLTVDDDNRTCYYSANGIHWHQWHQRTKNANFTSAPDEIGFFLNTHNAVYECGIHLFHWAES